MYHVAIGCADEAEVLGMAAKCDELDIERGPIADTPYAWVVTRRDPDRIAAEFFCHNPQ